MDDARIKQLSDEVLSAIRGPATAAELEQRVAALERAVGDPGRRPALTPATGPRESLEVVHQLLGVGGAAEGCVLEPGKPCSASGRCRSFGH